MYLKMKKSGIFSPPLHILANVTLKTIHLKTQITVHGLIVDGVRLLADCGLGFFDNILLQLLICECSLKQINILA